MPKWISSIPSIFVNYNKTKKWLDWRVNFVLFVFKILRHSRQLFVLPKGKNIHFHRFTKVTKRNCFASIGCQTKEIMWWKNRKKMPRKKYCWVNNRQLAYLNGGNFSPRYLCCLQFRLSLFLTFELMRKVCKSYLRAFFIGSNCQRWKRFLPRDGNFVRELDNSIDVVGPFIVNDCLGLPILIWTKMPVMLL